MDSSGGRRKGDGPTNWDFNGNVLKYLKPHGPDAILCFALFVLVIGAVGLGAGVWEAGSLAVALFLIYGVRQYLRERHLERTQDGDVRHKEIELDRYRVGQLARLEKEKIKAVASSPASGAIKGRRKRP